MKIFIQKRVREKIVEIWKKRTKANTVYNYLEKNGTKMGERSRHFVCFSYSFVRILPSLYLFCSPAFLKEKFHPL